MGKSKSKTTSKQRQEYRLPDYMNQGSRTAVRTAMDRMATPYQAYEGQRIQELSQNEQLGIQQAREGVGAWEGDVASAREALGRVGSITDEGALEGYMNPYIDAVLNPQLRNFGEAFDARRAERAAKAGMRGAFGGRRDIYEAQAQQDYLQGVSDITGAGRAAAFDKATDLYGQEQDRYMKQAGAYQDLAATGINARASDIKNLMATGMTERTRDQAERDFEYLQHLEERDWDIQNLDTLVKTLASVPHEYETYSEGEQTTTKSSSPLKTVAGLASITAGAIMTGGASLAAGGSFWGGIGESLMGLGMGGLAGGGE